MMTIQLNVILIWRRLAA